MDSLTTRFHEEVFRPYVDLLKSGYRFHTAFEHARRMWEEGLTAEQLINGPYLEKAQTYLEGATLDSLPLHNATRRTIAKKLDGRQLWKHQTDALQLILRRENTVIATGTSSGKTLCYQIPILDDLVRDPSLGVRAVIIYPLNALVNDQLTEWEQILAEHSQITFARFTGQTPATQREYEQRLAAAFEHELADERLTQQELKLRVRERVSEELERNLPNRLNHRDAIRSEPPHVLITNFSMLEYLLERPIDAPVFVNARLRFLVLDEAHAYRGVQATEIAFLIRRLKDRLHPEKLVCIATSATLGRQGNEQSLAKVRTFASELFQERFSEHNPIYGELAKPTLERPDVSPVPNQYLRAIEVLRSGRAHDVLAVLGIDASAGGLATALSHDKNLYRLRSEILTKPTRLSEAAKHLWPEDTQAEEGLDALLEVVAAAKGEQGQSDLLPTRLHYFVRAQGGLHVCLRLGCPGRCEGKAAFFVSRTMPGGAPEGECPECHREGQRSKLVEVVACRKCGYLYGALQDLGPRRARLNDPDSGPKPYFDSFSVELGSSSDSHWSYFAVDGDLPYPERAETDDEEERDDLLGKPMSLQWCVACGKKSDEGAGDNCACEKPFLRTIRLFHRQCPHNGKAKDHGNLLREDKKLLTTCPNCGTRDNFREPVQRFQESDDEVGMAMAIPLAHFQVTPPRPPGKPARKLLCFTDHRQRAAAFPSLLEEETFAHDMGRKILEILHAQARPIDVVSLAEHLADEEERDPQFFMPVSRFPDEELDARAKRNLWLAEAFAYFGVPDSARESVEDLGLVSVAYNLKEAERVGFECQRRG